MLKGGSKTKVIRPRRGAKALVMQPMYRPKVVKDKKTYTRKQKHRGGGY